MKMKELRTLSESLLTKYQNLRDRAEKEKIWLVKARKQLRDGQRAQQIVQTVAKEVQEKAHARIASVVSRCLKTVFGGGKDTPTPYQFNIRFERKRGKTEAILSFVRNKKEIDPTTASGGGVVDVASFALRVACLMLERPAKRKLLVLDEPFKFLSAEYRERVRDLILSLAEEMDIQFIFVTHIEELQIGKVIKL